MNTNKWAGTARTALGLWVLVVALLSAPIVTALDTDTSVQVPVSNPKPPSAPEQVVNAVGSTVNTQINGLEETMESDDSGLASDAPAAQISPSPLPESIPLGGTNGDVDDGSNVGGSSSGPNPSPSLGPNPTGSNKLSTSGFDKCATCSPSVRASRLPGVLPGDAGSAADELNAMMGGADGSNVKDLTADQSDGAAPPAAVPGFGPAFALIGLALLGWARRRLA